MKAPQTERAKRNRRKEQRRRQTAEARALQAAADQRGPAKHASKTARTMNMRGRGAAPEIEDGRRWHVLRLRPGWSGRVARELQELDIAVFQPRACMVVVSRGRRKTSRALVLSRTMFAGFAPDGRRLEDALALTGVDSVLRYSEGPDPNQSRMPAVIGARELREFAEAIARGEQVAPDGISVGQAILILSGPFASFPAVVAEIVKPGRVRADVSIFGRASAIELDLADLQAA